MELCVQACACQDTDVFFVSQADKPLTKRQKAMLQSRALKRSKGQRKSATKAIARGTSPKLSYAGSIESSLNISADNQRVAFPISLAT